MNIAPALAKYPGKIPEKRRKWQQQGKLNEELRRIEAQKPASSANWR